MSPRRGEEEEGGEAGDDAAEVIDKQSMSSSTVLSNMLFKPATVHGKVAKLHLARAIEAYNMAIKIQSTEQARSSNAGEPAEAEAGAGEGGAPAEALQVVRFRGRGKLCTDRVLLVVSDHREAGTPVIDSSMLKPGEIYFNRGKVSASPGSGEGCSAKGEREGGRDTILHLHQVYLGVLSNRKYIHTYIYDSDICNNNMIAISSGYIL